MICRDTSWWDGIANHEAVAPHVFMGLPAVTLAPLVEPENSFPMASINGGLIFAPLDNLGFVFELHTLYKPEGWGREVHAHAKECFRQMMERASIIVTHEQEGSSQTRPPLSFGWKSSGIFREVGLPKRLRMWVLTKEAWESSPVGRKLCLS